MKSTNCVSFCASVVSSVAIILVPGMAFSAVVEWRLQDGGNGHLYEEISAPNGIDWFTAKAEAEKRGGYLATVTSVAENTFIFSKVDSSQNWIDTDPQQYGPWLGGFQSASGSEPAGGWSWVTGEPFSYTAWAPGEPNNQGGDEEYLHYFSFNTPANTWNDAVGAASMRGYVVEYDTPIPPMRVPTQMPRNLVLVTHGWNTSQQTFDGWVTQMTAAIASRLPAEQRNNWQVIGYDWTSDSGTLLTGPIYALEQGAIHGQDAGATIALANYEHVHLIGHSAGSALVSAVADQLNQLSPTTTVHYTYLDPYVPPAGPQYYTYGSHRAQDWAENYFSVDAFTAYDTAVRLPNAHNVNVTFLDPDWLLHFFQPATSHSWPYEYYIQTVLASPYSSDLAAPHGFQLSLEGGHTDELSNGWRNPVASLLEGALAVPHGTGSVPFATIQVDAPLRADTLISYTTGGDAASPIAHDALLFGSSTSTYGWSRMLVDFDNPFNGIVLHAHFHSQLALGTLEVYLDDRPVGQLNESNAIQGNHAYAFAFDDIDAGIHELAFRFDRTAGSGNAVIDITDVRTIFVPVIVPEPSTMLLCAIGISLIASRHILRVRGYCPHALGNGQAVDEPRSQWLIRQ
ncbi:MAG: lectin-like protein [Pirellulales bacterium]